MSTDNPENEQPLAVSALRSRFEKLAQDTSTPRTRTALTTAKTSDSNALLSPAPHHLRVTSSSDGEHESPVQSIEHQLRQSSSSSDLRRRPPPPPPPARPAKPQVSISPLPSPIIRPTPITANTSPIPTLQVSDRLSLMTRKPPPPPSSAPPTANVNESYETNDIPGNGLATLRSKFS